MDKSKETGIKRKTRRSLSSSKKRVTRQRALLLELLGQEYFQHLDAGELYRLARRRLPRLSLSTVYRSLQVFKRMGLVEEHHFAEDHHHYEIKPRASHQHLQCVGCGKIVEFNHPITDRLKEIVGKEHGFLIRSLDLELTGLCAECQRRKK